VKRKEPKSAEMAAYWKGKPTVMIGDFRMAVKTERELE
jgi:hypothetical protein